MKKLQLTITALALVFSSCYFNNTPVQPSLAGFHIADSSPFLTGSQRISGMASDGKGVVAVSERGTIAFSPDHGVTWEKIEEKNIAGNFSGGIAFHALTWGAGFYLAAGDGGMAAYSADGEHWEAGVIGPMSPKNILCVAAGFMGGRAVFTAGGTDGRLARAAGSPAGPWVAAELTPFGDQDMRGETVRCMAFGKINGNGIFVAAGDNGKIAFMKDFSGNWYGTRAGIAEPFTSIAFGNDRFVAVGTRGIIRVSSNPVSYYWQQIKNTDFEYRSFSGAAFDPLLKHFVIYTEDSAVGFSEFAESWNAAAFAGRFPDGISAIACTDKRIVLGGSDGTIMYSN